MTPHRERLAEWLLAGYMVAWGLVLLMPFRTFGQVQYEMLAALADEKVWGMFSLCIGIMRCGALWVNGRHRSTPALRMAGASFGVVWWATLLYFFISWDRIASIPAGVLAFYPVNILFEFYSVYRTGIDAFEAGTFKRKRARGS